MQSGTLGPPHPSCMTLGKSLNLSSLKDFMLTIFLNNPPPQNLEGDITILILQRKEKCILSS